MPARQPATLDDLIAFEAIRRIKADYCRFVDTKQWRRLPDLFTANATVAGFGSAPDGSDAAAFVAGVENFLGPALSIHHVHTPQIELRGADAARAAWPMMDYVDFPEGSRPGGVRGWIGWGFYEEDYVRTDGRWRVSFMRLARLRMDDLTDDHPAARMGRVPPDPTWI